MIEDKHRHEIPLGNDYALAMKEWAALKMKAPLAHTQIIAIRYVAERYIKEVELLINMQKLPGKC